MIHQKKMIPPHLPELTNKMHQLKTPLGLLKHLGFLFSRFRFHLYNLSIVRYLRAHNNLERTVKKYISRKRYEFWWSYDWFFASRIDHKDYSYTPDTDSIRTDCFSKCWIGKIFMPFLQFVSSTVKNRAGMIPRHICTTPFYHPTMVL